MSKLMWIFDYIGYSATENVFLICPGFNGAVMHVSRNAPLAPCMQQWDTMAVPSKAEQATVVTPVGVQYSKYVYFVHM